MTKKTYSKQFMAELGDVLAASRASQFAHVAARVAVMLKREPACKVLHILGGEALAELGELEEARTLCQIGLSHHPRCELLSVMLLHVLMKMNRRRDARDEMKRFLECAQSPEYERIIIEAKLQAATRSWKRGDAKPAPPLVGNRTATELPTP